MKSLWDSIFIIDNDAVEELKEILEHMRSLSKEDRKLIGKPLIK
jgi:hypothetical protein